jgi:hypothetical protein
VIPNSEKKHGFSTDQTIDGKHFVAALVGTWGLYNLGT